MTDARGSPRSGADAAARSAGIAASRRAIARPPRVLLMIRHPAMRRLVEDLLRTQCGCRTTSDAEVDEGSAAAPSCEPDLVIIDTARFPDAAHPLLGRLPMARAIVIGPEPEPAYEVVAKAHGAAAWLSRDAVGTDLGNAVRELLGPADRPYCRCAPADRPYCRCAEAPPTGELEANPGASGGRR